MAQNPIRTTIDSTRGVAGSAQEHLQAILREISRTTEAQAAQVQATLQELVERSRESSERLAQAVDERVQAQLRSLGLATKADIARLERQIAELQRVADAPRPARPSAEGSSVGRTGAELPSWRAAKKADAGAATAKKAAKRAAGGKTAKKAAAAKIPADTPSGDEAGGAPEAAS